ncbi:hypothetical protein Tco_1180573 [Tanacetum coccineum]
MAASSKRHEENSNIIKEIRASTDAAIRNQGASIKTLEIQIKEIPCIPYWSRKQMAKEPSIRLDYSLGKLLMKCPQHYLTDMQEVILFYNGLDIPTRQILDSKGATPSKTTVDAKIAIQEMAEYSQKRHNETSSRTRSTKTFDGLAAIQAQLNNLGREIKKVNEKVYAAQVGCELCKGPHYTKDFTQKEEGQTLEEAYYT